jgi:hypothetical protein
MIFIDPNGFGYLSENKAKVSFNNANIVLK